MTAAAKVFLANPIVLAIAAIVGDNYFGNCFQTYRRGGEGKEFDVRLVISTD